jgi:hypothetical protein
MMMIGESFNGQKDARMFRDLNGYYPRPDRPERPRRLTARQEKVMIAILCFNVLVLIIAPIGGVSMIEVLFP